MKRLQSPRCFDRFTDTDAEATAELLLVAAVYLRYLADDVGPRQPSAMLKDTLIQHASTADALRRKLGLK